MSQQLEYLDRSEAAAAMALQARIEQDSDKLESFKNHILKLEGDAVQSGNIALELGESFAGYHLPPSSEMAEGYFREHYAPKLGISFRSFLQFIRIYKRKPKKFVGVGDVFPTMKLLFEASGSIDAGHRQFPQRASQQTPYLKIFKNLRNAQDHCDQVLETHTEWDAGMKASIVYELNRMEQWAHAAAAKVGRVRPVCIGSGEVEATE